MTTEVLDRPRTRDQTSVRIASVTPAMAQAWLETGGINRNVSVGVVDAYARLMTSGQWILNGDTLAFSTEGKMLNGQHRCRAIVKSSQTIDMIVVEGVDPSAIETMDDGRRRSVTDNLHISGTPTPQAAVSAARWLLRLRMGMGPSRRITNLEVLQLMHQHPGLATSAMKLRGDSADVVVMPSIFTAIHYLGGEILRRREDAEAMFQVLVTGVPAYEGDPVHMLRERLLKHQKQNANLNAITQWHCMVEAWNAFAEKTPVKKFKIPEESALTGLDIAKI